MIKVLFCGTAEFAVPTLQKLLEADFVQLVGVVTQPDRPAGRKQLLTPSPVKAFLQGQANAVQLFQPEKLKEDAATILSETNPDLIVVVAYGQILPAEMIDSPKFGCLNIHGSLLPMYRGAVPIEAALLNGDSEVGVSILKMTPGLDDGPVLAEKSVAVNEEADAASLRADLSVIGAELLLEILPKWISGELQPIDQERLAADKGRKLSFCSAKDLARERAELHPGMDAVDALRRIKAFAAGSGAWMELYWQGKLTELKVWKARLITSDPSDFGWGKFRRKGSDLELVLAGGKLQLLELQLAGKQRGPVDQYLYLDKGYGEERSARVIVRVEDEILVIKRFKRGFHYHTIPGGHLDSGETLAAGAIRELFEETDIKATPNQLQEIFKLEKTTFFLLTLESKPEVKFNGEEKLRETPDNTYDLVWIKLADTEQLKMVMPPEVQPELRKLL
jgi:methionyl-tRNA formyltransferase